jgi:hypothetical protein
LYFFRGPRPGHSRSRRHTVGIAGFLVTGLIAAVGFSGGFHRRVPANEWGRFVFALYSAITAAKHGVGGFVGFELVEAALKANGLTSDEKILSEIDRRFPRIFPTRTSLHVLSSTPLRLKFRSSNAKLMLRRCVVGSAFFLPTPPRPLRALRGRTDCGSA